MNFKGRGENLCVPALRLGVAMTPCGADAAPYFRVFNPVLQGEKFDPDGAYVRRWVPELAGFAARFVHRPWAAPEPPRDYPAQIVDHAQARARALAAFQRLKE